MSQLEYCDDYRFVMSDAHRRPAHHLGMPAIAWHMAFWQPRMLTDADWIDRIEILILNIFDRACDIARSAQNAGAPAPTITNLQINPAESTTGPHQLLRAQYIKASDSHKWNVHSEKNASHGTVRSRYETVQMNFVWETMPVTIRIEVFEEYFTLSCFISFWKNPKDPVASIPKAQGSTLYSSTNPTFSNVLSALTSICDSVSSRRAVERNTAQVRQERRDSIDKFRTSKACEIAFSGVWSQLESELLGQAKTADLGKVFADFRGLILQCDLEGGDTGAADGLQRLSAPCTSVSQTHTAAVAGVPFGTNADVLNWTEALLPILLSLESDNTLRNNPADTVEYTFSMTGHDRCIFGTGFGHQAPHDSHPTLKNLADRKGKPISYLILSAHDDHREIGRIINRLHTMGTLRLASLQFLAPMVDVELRLSQMRQDLVDTSAQLSNLSKLHEETATAANRLGANERAIAETHISDRLGDVRDALIELDKSVHGGISNRTLRSGYYLDRFNALMRAMDFKRIAGYQPYDQFVGHRLDRAFGKIAEVGAHRKEVSELERTIRGQYLHYKSENHQFVIRRIQFWAEVAFLLIVLPHYLSEILNAAVNPHWDNIPFPSGAHPYAYLDFNHQSVALFCFVGCLTIGAVRYKDDVIGSVKRSPAKIRKRAIWIILGFPLILFLAVVAAKWL